MRSRVISKRHVEKNTIIFRAMTPHFMVFMFLDMKDRMEPIQGIFHYKYHNISSRKTYSKRRSCSLCFCVVESFLLSEKEILQLSSFLHRQHSLSDLKASIIELEWQMLYRIMSVGGNTSGHYSTPLPPKWDSKPLSQIART